MTSRITPEQASQICALAEAAVRQSVQEVLASMNLSQEEAQRVIDLKENFQDYYKEAAKVSLKGLYLTNQYKDEEVESSHYYLSGYQGPGSINDQLIRLKQLFPEVGGANPELVAKIESGEVTLSNIPKRYPEEDRNFWCLPHWSKVAPTYSEAVSKVFALLSDIRAGVFYNSTKGLTDHNHLRETERKARMMNEQHAKQGADVIILELQFGLRHRGRSVRRVRAVMSGAEFGLGIYEIAVMLLLSPKRLVIYHDLWIDASGDEWRPEGTGIFVYAPYLGFYRDRVQFGCRKVQAAGDGCGSASAFVAQ